MVRDGNNDPELPYNDWNKDKLSSNTVWNSENENLNKKLILSWKSELDCNIFGK